MQDFPAGHLQHLKSERILPATSELASKQAGFGSTSSCAFPFKIHCSILPSRWPSQLRQPRTLMWAWMWMCYLSQLKEVCMCADHLIPGLIFFPGNYNTQQNGNRVGHVETLYKCMCKTGGQYLPAIALWRPLGECPQHCGSHFTMEKVQQRVCIDFCFCLGKTGAETYEILQAPFGESCLSRTKTFEWYSRFKSGHWSFEDKPRPGRLPPPTPRRPWKCARNHSCWPTSDYQRGCRRS